VTRLERARTYIAAGLSEVFSRYGLSAADFQVVVNLRRAGSPYRLPQARLMKALTLTSGTVSVRIERLVKLGIVTREPDPADARGQLVQLTSRGLQLFDDIAPVHLADETPGGPAAEAGVSRGDLLVTAGGVPARSEADVRAALAAAAGGTALQLRFLRGETEFRAGLATVR